MTIPLAEYHGRVICERAASGLRVIEARYPARLQVPTHRHATLGLALTLAGLSRESYSDHVLECPARAVKLQPPGASHRNEYGPMGARLLVLQLDPSVLPS